MNKDYYKEYYYYERENWWFKVRYRIIDYFLGKHITNRENLRILNIGVATGHSTEILMKYGDVKSLEYDSDCCKFTREMLNIEIIEGSIKALPFSNEEFDVVCAFDVLEHIDDDKLAVSEIRRVCKKNGLVFITVPAFMTLWSRHDEINFHFRRYRKKQILNLFGNFRNLHHTYFNTFLFLPIFIFRSITRLFPDFRKTETGSDFSVLPKKSILNKFFFTLFNLEYQTLKIVKYPFGVSYLYVGQKH